MSVTAVTAKSEGKHSPAGLADCCDWRKKDNAMTGVKASIHLHEGFPATGASMSSLALQAGCSHHEVAGGETPSCAFAVSTSGLI